MENFKPRRLSLLISAVLPLLAAYGGGASGESADSTTARWAGSLSYDGAAQAGVAGSAKAADTPATSLVAALLPSSLSVQVGATATASATIINSGTTAASGCTIAPSTSVAATFSFQAISPLAAAANVPVDIPAGAAQNFLIALTPTAAFAPTDVAFAYSCANQGSAASISGVNTLLMSGSAAPVV